MTLIQQKTGIVLAEAEDSEKCYLRPYKSTFPFLAVAALLL